jgi:hypothetical protein
MSSSFLLLGLIVVFFAIYFPVKWLVTWLLGGTK